jgi:[acyl-carrier-protein] S-malonyltransferase
MELMKSVFLFPGQGAYVQGILPLLTRNWPSIREIFKKVDFTCYEAGCAQVSDVLDASEPPDLETLVRSAPAQLQLILYCTSIAAFGLLREMQKQPFWLMGHSFGEISALVCAGAFSIEDGARIIHARNRALGGLKQTDGAMIALNIGSDRAEALVRLLDDPSVRVACHNAPRQCVLSGPKAAMHQAQALAIALGFGSTFVASPYAFHNPMLAPAVEEFAKAIRHLRQRPLEHPTYSPISGRLYDDQDILSDLIAGHLVRPVAFTDALRKAYAAGIDGFVECGAGATLVGLATRALPSIRTYAPLSATKTLETELTSLSGRVPASSVRTAIPATPAPVVQTRPPQIDVVAPVDRPVSVRQQPREPLPAADVAPRMAHRQVVAAVRGVCADLMGYPPEVFEEDADLEADLGIDSIKRTQLELAILEHLKLPADTRGIMAGTFGELVATVIAVQEAQQGRSA